MASHNSENNNEEESITSGFAPVVRFEEEKEEDEEENGHLTESESEISISSSGTLNHDEESSYDEDFDMPELEDDPVQRIPAGVYAPRREPLPEEEEGEEERECWVCFMGDDPDSPGAEWVHPCKCTGSVGFVHQDCVKRWVAEKQKNRLDLEGSFSPREFEFSRSFQWNVRSVKKNTVSFSRK